MHSFLPSLRYTLCFGCILCPVLLQGATFSEPLLPEGTHPSVQQSQATPLSYASPADSVAGNSDKEEHKQSTSPPIAIAYQDTQVDLNLLELSSEARMLIDVASCLPPAPLPVCLVATLLEAPSDLPIEHHPAWCELSAIGLAQTQEGGYLISAPSPISSNVQLQRGYHMLGKALLQVWCYDYHAPLTWQVTEVLAPVLATLWEEVKEDDTPPRDLFPCLAGLIHYQLTFKEDHDTTVCWAEAFVRVCKEQLGTTHPDTGKAHGILALVYEAQRRYEEAFEQHEQAQQKLESILGRDHPDALIALHNLANGYYRKGAYDQAIALHEEGLALISNAIDRKDLAIATTQNSLGAIHYEQGAYSEAIIHYQQALEIYLDKLGKGHPSVATTHHNLAVAHEKEGNLSGAIEHYSLALPIWEETLGKDHTLTSMLRHKLEKAQHSQSIETSQVGCCHCL